MDIKETLIDLGLSQRETAIYIELLGIESASPAYLARKTGLKRSTLYLDLESLRRKKLIGLSMRGKRTVYVAEPLTHLLSSIREQESTALRLMPYIAALANRKVGQPQVRYYDDPKDIHRVWVEETFNAKRNDYLAHYAETLKEFSDLEVKYQAKIDDGTIQEIRELTPFSQESVNFALRHISKKRPIRILPKGKRFDVDISIWDNKTAIYSNARKYMLVIDDPAIAQSYRTLIEIAWSVSLTPEEAEKKLKLK